MDAVDHILLDAKIKAVGHFVFHAVLDRSGKNAVGVREFVKNPRQRSAERRLVLAGRDKNCRPFRTANCLLQCRARVSESFPRDETLRIGAVVDDGKIAGRVELVFFRQPIGQAAAD